MVRQGAQDYSAPNLGLHTGAIWVRRIVSVRCDTEVGGSTSGFSLRSAVVLGQQRRSLTMIGLGWKPCFQQREWSQGLGAGGG